MAINRATVRKRLTQLIKEGVPSAQAVYAYQVGSLDGMSPVILVVSSGISRPRFTLRNRKATLYFGVHVFVKHVDLESNWTEEQAEDMLDQIEHEVATTFEGASEWAEIKMDDPSLVDKVVSGGVPYLYEVIPVTVEVLNG